MRRAIACVSAALAAVLVALPAGAEANTRDSANAAAIGGAPVGLTTERPDLTQTPLVRPSALCFDPLDGELFVSSRGSQPGVYAYKTLPTVRADGSISLPAGAVPQDLEMGTDGFLYVLDNGNHQIDKIDPKRRMIVDTFPQPAGAGSANGLAFGFQLDVVQNAGNADTRQPGSVFYGRMPNFPGSLSFGDTRFPNGVDLLPETAGLSGTTLPALFLFLDAQNNDLVKLSDSPAPVLGGVSPGPPAASGATPGTDLSVLPIDIAPKPNGAGTLPILVPVPGQGQIYESPQPGAPWFPLFPGPIGRPVRVDADCDQLAWTDFSAGAFYVAGLEKPKPPARQCDALLAEFKVGLKLTSGKPLTLVVDLGGAMTLDARLNASFNPVLSGSGGATGAAAVKTGTGSAHVVAGRAKRLNLRFSPSQTRAIQRTLQKRHRANGTVTIRVTSPAGETATITHRLRLRSH